MAESISIDEYKKFHPEQWVKLYGIFSNRYDYIVTCQVYQLEVVLGGSRRDWWDGFILEPVDEQEQPMSVEEAFLRYESTVSEEKSTPYKSSPTGLSHHSISS